MAISQMCDELKLRWLFYVHTYACKMAALTSIQHTVPESKSLGYRWKKASSGLILLRAYNNR